MRNTICAGIAVVALVVCGAMAEAAQPSAAKMSQMGLSGATVVSDSLAMDVRGFGYSGGRTKTRSVIWGESKVKVEINTRPVDIELKSEHGYHSVSGGSQVGGDLSFVGAAIVAGGTGNNAPAALNGGGGGVHGAAIILFSGGASGVKVGGRR